MAEDLQRFVVLIFLLFFRESGLTTDCTVGQLVPQVPVKSILKPTLPLSPIQQIPAHRSSRASKQSSMSSSNPQPSSAGGLLNFQPPPFPSNAVPTTVPVRTEEEQQRRSEILAARAARRQSLGNRRVSFAPEATLHTWDVVEYYRGDDGSTTTTSSASSRVSTPATSSTNKSANFPPEVEETPTPAQAPELHLPETPPSVRQKGDNLPTQIPPMDFNNPSNEDFSSPFSSSPGTEGVQSPFAGIPEGDDSSDSDSMDGGFGDETVGGRSFVSAAEDTMMGVTKDMTDDEPGAFKAFGKRTAWKIEGATETVERSTTGEGSTDETKSLEGEITMETTRPVGGILPTAPSLAVTEPEDDGGDMTMDMTRPVGGLLSFDRPAPAVEDDMTVDMDLTRPVGGILKAAKATEKATQRQPLVQYDDETEEEDGEDMDVDMDITRPIGGILPDALPKRSPPFEADDQTMDMDFTRPIGGILSSAPPQTQHNLMDDDQTMDMDMTRPLGGIIDSAKPRALSPTSSDAGGNEEMTMELTSVLGGIIGTNKPIENNQGKGRRRSSLGIRRGGGMMNKKEWERDQAERRASLEKQEATMDMTTAVGRILSAAPQSGNNEAKEPASFYPTLPNTGKPEGGDETEEEEDVSMEGVTMDVTTAIGRIIQTSGSPPSNTGDQSALPQAAKDGSAKEGMPAPVAPSVSLLQEELGAMKEQGSPTPAKRRTSKRLSAASSASGSEKRVTRRSTAAARKSLENAQSQSPIPTPVFETPQTKKTPKAKPAESPKPQFVEERKEGFVFATPQKKLAFSQPRTPPDQLTPAIPLKPKTPSKKTPVVETPLRAGGLNEGFSLSAKKRIGFPVSPSPRKHTTPARATTPGSTSSTRGIGINRPGLGSPRIVARLSSRKSIGEGTPTFSPITIPRDLLKAAREDAAADMKEEREANEREVERRKSLDLRSRIEMLTPRKKSRKSLAYGALLAGVGKRERSDDYEEELGGGKRRRKSEEPVAVGDTGIVMTPQARTPRAGDRPTLPTPGSGKRQTPRKRAVVFMPDTPEVIKSPSPVPSGGEDDDMEMEMDMEVQDDEMSEEEPRLSLQEFLGMTSISFLDGLTTTKRRQTGFTGLRVGRRSVEGEPEATLTDCIIAAACTVPMLDLFQYSCRELKKYIREGQEVIKTIEADTLEENPLLFKEYITAPPDVKVIMDTQFKNVKTHARFVAKGIWYEWRMKLLDSVRTALQDNLKGLKEDEEVLAEARAAGDKILPGITGRFEAAKNKLNALREVKRRVESDDQEQLAAARANLQSVREKIEAAKSKLAAGRSELDSLDAQLAERQLQKETLQGCIEEAERVKEMNRGWSEEEVGSWKEKVNALEKSFGWSISSANDGVLELSFSRQLRLTWDSKGRAPPRAEYLVLATSKPSDPVPLSPEEQDFFVTALNSLLQPLTSLKDAVAQTDSFWRQALHLSGRIRKVKRFHPTQLSISPSSAPALNVRFNVLIPEIRSKLSILVSVEPSLSVSAGAKVVYGGVKECAVTEFLQERVKEEGGGGFHEHIVEQVVERCLEGRRRKGGVGIPTKA